MKKPGSLRRRLMWVVMSSTSAALLLSAVALFLYEVRSYRVNLVSELTSEADLLSLSIGPALAFNDAKAAATALSALKLRATTEVAAIYSKDGRPFATYVASEELAAHLPALAPGIGFRFVDDSIELAYPVEQNDEVLGTVFLRDRHNLTSRIVDYIGILAAATIAGLGLAALIYRRLHPTVTRPILAMADVARRVKRQRTYELQVAETSDDEVGTLVTSFNDMLRELSTEMNERRRAEEALRVADRRKDEFLATLAHELRNPLAPIANALAILKLADANPEVRREARAIMERQLAQMVRLIGDLLEVSRITTGKLELRRAVIDLVAVGRSALESVEPVMRSSNHALEVVLPPEPVWVDADALRLAQVFVNLLHNAAKYTAPGGHIRLAVERAEPLVRITVTDDGIGIDPAMQAAIFEMFVQADRSLERGAAGLGVGLTIARQLVELHGGSIAVQSAGLGRGSTFTVLLPLAVPAAPRPAAATAAPAAAHGLRVLIADDNVDFALSFGRLLGLDGHAVTIVHDGTAALQAASTTPPDVAFLDIGMPGLNGYDLARSLRAKTATGRAVLVAVTGWGQEADRRRVEAAGFDHHLVKPVDPERLRQILAAAERSE